MRDLKHMTGCSAERLARHLQRATDDSWHDVRDGGRVILGDDARVFVRKGCRITVGSAARLSVHNGTLFVLGNFALMPRSDVHLYHGMMVLGDGCLGYGSVIACDEKVWIADAEIGAMCHIADTDGHRIFRSDGSEVSTHAPVIVRGHVFVGPGSMVLKGSDIGAGTVVGPRSTVNGELPASCYAAGSPAVPVEHGVTWKRPETPIHEML